MKTQKITSDKKDVHVECPHCGALESHPIDEQRHHLQYFDIVEWRDNSEVEVSLVRCKDCDKEFELEWSYKNKLPLKSELFPLIIDFEELKFQKMSLLSINAKMLTGSQIESIVGIVNIIDAIQDYAVEILGYEESEVFNLLNN